MANEELDSLRRQMDKLNRRLTVLEREAAEAASAQTLEARRAEPPGGATKPVSPRFAPPGETTPEMRPVREKHVVSEEPAEPQVGAAVAAPSAEEYLGGRVLGWVGALAILAGVVFFFGMAIDRGWIDETTRIVLATVLCVALLGAGAWLHEKKGQTEAALAAMATGLAGLFVTLVVGSQIYDVIAPAVGLALAGLVGVVAAAAAIRWEATVIAAIGIVGALLAPVLVGADASSASTFGFMTIALVASVAVLIWQKWNWLALCAFFVSAPQLVAWTSDNYEDRIYLTLLVLAAFWALNVVAAVGYELRVRSTEGLPVASWVLLLLNVLLIASGGYLALTDLDYTDAATAWVIGLAGAHIGLGALALRQPISREIGALLVAAGLGLSALGFADALEGPALVCGWALQAVVLAYMSTRAATSPTQFGSNARRLVAGSAVFLGLALGHTLAYEAPPIGLVDGTDHLGTAVVALGVCALAILASAYFWRLHGGNMAGLAEVVGGTVLVYLSTVAIVDAFDGAALVLAWAAQAVVLAFLATVASSESRFFGSNAQWLVAGSVLFLGLAYGHILLYEAPPKALFEGVDSLGQTVAALAVSAAAATGCGYFWRKVEGVGWAEIADLVVGVTLVYLVSVAIIDTVGVTEGGDSREVGQFWLSAFWGVTGIASLVFGLVRRDKRVRLAGLALVGITIGKVFTYDLSELDEMARVGSFVAVGLLLLVGAFAYQRMQVKLKEEGA